MQSLSVKYRPKDFNEILGQDMIIQILKRQVENQSIKNCYLFSGPSGDGKTTTARAFAYLINNNQGNPIEIDAASNNGVDNIKQIIKTASERSIDSKYKVYIIDEAHMLTTAAWNAFLKTLEEPPVYTIFIFCTTDPQKIPITIMNRMMRFNFQRLNNDTIYQRLLYICKQENFNNYVESCEYVSKICNGCMREAISLIEKAADFSIDLSLNNVIECLGNYSFDLFFELLNNLIDRKENEVISCIQNLYNRGQDLKLFYTNFISFCLDVNKYLIFRDVKITNIPSSYEDKLQFSIKFENANLYYIYLIDKLIDIKKVVTYDSDIKTNLTIALLRICRGQ